MKLTLRKKLLFFSVLLAIIPLGIAGNRMISITQDELKSAANDELTATSNQIAITIDNFYQDTWLTPLKLIKNALENEFLGVSERISILTSTQESEDIVSLQLDVEGIADPVMVRWESFSKSLEEAGLDPREALLVPRAGLKSSMVEGASISKDIEYLEKADIWLLSIKMPLSAKISGRNAVLSARINLERLIMQIEDYPFSNGMINIVNENGMELLTSEREDLSSLKIVDDALASMKSNRAYKTAPYTRPDGKEMLAAFSFPDNFNWAVISQRYEEDAYIAVYEMFVSLMLWVGVGLVLAVIGGIFYSTKISKPILHIADVAKQVGQGNFNVRVAHIKSRDEIYRLAKRMNSMIEGLRERFELQKFVSANTIDAIKKSDQDGIKLGGERANATVFFSDIRGFTAFSEQVEPEIVIEMLNTYLRHQADIVKQHKGDIDKFVGDEMVAVFKGDDMVKNAVKAAIEIQEKIEKLNNEHPQWDIPVGIGINSGDMIMGAMGSEERMDYTILGDNVNLGARLCSSAKAYEIILSANAYNQIKDLNLFKIETLEPIKVKGKTNPINIYSVKGYLE